MNYISCKASNRSNTVCISRFDNAADDIIHRKAAVKEVFRGSHKSYCLARELTYCKSKGKIHIIYQEVITRVKAGGRCAQ